MKSFLRLKNYTYPEILVKSNANFNRDNLTPIHYLDEKFLSVELTTALNAESDTHLALFLQINTKEEAEQIPYQLRVSIAGEIEIIEKINNFQQIAIINGASLLYSALRDFVLGLTARAPFGELFLPTINFLVFIKEQIEKNKPKLELDNLKTEPVTKKVKKTIRPQKKN